MKSAQIVFCRIAVLLVMLLGVITMPKHCAAQSSGPSVDECNSGVLDWYNNVEETVCLYGDASSMNAYEQVDDNYYNPDGAVGYVAALAPTGEEDTPNESLWFPCQTNGSAPYLGNCPGYNTTPSPPNGQYTLNGYYQECWDSQGTFGNEYPCYWQGTSVGLSVSVDLEANPSIAYPMWEVTSILYSPPGNRSSAGFTNSTTNGKSETVGSSFQNSTSTTYSFGGSFTPFFSATLNFTFGQSTTQGNSTQNTETFTDAQGIGLANQSSSPNAIDHTQDLFVIWMNPAVAINELSPATGIYAMGTQTDSNGSTEQPDFIFVTARTMRANANGSSSVDPQILVPQLDSNGQRTLPGLASICANLNQAEYAAAACTLGDQCGCTPSDFAPILAEDPLLNYQGTGNPYPSTASILAADTDGSACSSPHSNNKCRYVPVPSSPGSSIPQTVWYSGPQCFGCGIPTDTYTQTDSNQTTQTLSEAQATTVGYSWKVNVLGLNFNGPSHQFTWSNSESTGAINGYANSQTFNLQSATQNCYEDGILVYEDTVYHTFVLQEPTGNNTCP